MLSKSLTRYFLKAKHNRFTWTPITSCNWFKIVDASKTCSDHLRYKMLGEEWKSLIYIPKRSDNRWIVSKRERKWILSMLRKADFTEGMACKVSKMGNKPITDLRKPRSVTRSLWQQKLEKMNYEAFQVLKSSKTSFSVNSTTQK